MRNKLLFFITTAVIISGVYFLFDHLNKIYGDKKEHKVSTATVRITDNTLPKYENCNDEETSTTLTIYTAPEEAEKLYKGQTIKIISDLNEQDTKTYKGKIYYISKITEPVPAFKNLDYSKIFMAKKFLVNTDNMDYCKDDRPEIILSEKIQTE